MGRTRQLELAAFGEFPRNITLYLGIVIGTDAGGGNCAFVAIIIIRSLCIGRLRVTLDLRVVGRQACGSGVFARVALSLVTIQLFGIPVVGVFYTSRLT